MKILNGAHLIWHQIYKKNLNILNATEEFTRHMVDSGCDVWTMREQILIHQEILKITVRLLENMFYIVWKKILSLMACLNQKLMHISPVPSVHFTQPQIDSIWFDMPIVIQSLTQNTWRISSQIQNLSKGTL